MPIYHDVVQARRSIRAFLPEPLPEEVLSEIFAEAQQSPSNCNTQPWHMHVVSGNTLRKLGDTLRQQSAENLQSLDFSFDKDAYPEPYKTRATEQGRSYYRALGVAREDVQQRRKVIERNEHFFGAPHAAFLFIPQVGDNVRVAADAGMFAQTFLLSLTARGYAGVPQAALSYQANTVRSVLRVPQIFKLLMGISFGRADETHASFNYRQPRSPWQENIIQHD